LRFIVAHGDACFNQAQIPVLLDELRRILPSITEPKAKDHVQRIVRLVEGAVGAHTYVWFMSD